MFTKRITLFKAFGFPIMIDLSWIFIFLLVSWSLAKALFPQMLPGRAQETYWTLGIIAALGLFVSVVLHELGHAVVARRHGMDIRSITLFIFGGVAELASEPPTAKAEFQVAIGGPIVSALLAGLFAAAAALQVPDAAGAALRYLAYINGIVLLFNLVPAFPLDGGRVLRAALWHWKGSLRWATRIAAGIGSGFGIALIAIGALNLLAGSVVGALWYSLLGLFLKGAANMAYQQVLVRRLLEGEPVRRFMTPNPIAIGADESLETLVEDYFYRHHHKLFPVLENGKLVGCVSPSEIKPIDRANWSAKRVREVMQPLSDGATLSQDADAMEALARINRQKRSRYLVIDESGELVGILTLKDLMDLLAIKMDLDTEADADEALAAIARSRS